MMEPQEFTGIVVEIGIEAISTTFVGGWPESWVPGRGSYITVAIAGERITLPWSGRVFPRCGAQVALTLEVES